MGLIDIISFVAKKCPKFRIKSKKFEYLEGLDLDITKEQYCGFAIIISFLISVLLFLLLINLDILLALSVSLFSFSTIFLFFLYLPEIELKQRVSKIEAEMPFALRTISMLLNMNIDFVRVLDITSETKDEIGNELQIIVAEIDEGVTVHKAFSRFSSKYNSIPVKRAVSQLISAYDIGSSGNEIKKIADELMALEQHKLKEYSSKSAIFGLLFIVVTTIVPVFFLVYSILGNLALDTQMSRFDILIGMLVIFPLISLLILLMSRSMLPHSPFYKKPGTEIQIIGIALLFIVIFLFVPEELRMIFVIGGCALSFGFTYKNYKKEKQIEELENYLPDGLFAIANLPKSTKIEHMFEVIENLECGALSKEARKSRIQIQNNVSVDAVLDDLGKRNHSLIIKRVGLLLKHVFNSNSFDQLNNLAEDILKSFEIKRERAQTTGLQKYTLIFGAVIIPLILKITLHLLTDMSEFFEKQAFDIIEFSSSLVLPYIILYALITSTYISDIEGKKSGSIVYFLLMFILALTGFYLINLQ